MRSALLALAILAPMPALADGHELMPSLGDAFAIRECKDYFVNGPTTMEVKSKNICYQEVVSKTFVPEAPIPPFTVTREITRQIDCEDYQVSTLPTNVPLDQQVAGTYCGDDTLEAAPFLR